MTQNPQRSNPSDPAPGPAVQSGCRKNGAFAKQDRMLKGQARGLAPAAQASRLCVLPASRWLRQRPAGWQQRAGRPQHTQPRRLCYRKAARHFWRGWKNNLAQARPFLLSWRLRASKTMPIPCPSAPPRRRRSLPLLVILGAALLAYVTFTDGSTAQVLAP